MVKFGVVIPLIFYYIIMGVVFTFSSGVFDNYNGSNFNDFSNTQSNITGGTFDWIDYGINLLAFIGVGFTSDSTLPSFFQALFTAWCVIINIIAFLVFIQILRGS